jgi:hypothetical protein
VMPEPAGYAIMSASVRLPSGRLLCSARYSDPRVEGVRRRCWIDLFASDDNGESWRLLSTPVPDTGRGGNPPTLTLLQDGRLAMTYGFRDAPFEMRALLSSDGGETWSEERVLRSGAGNHDIGYPRTIQRADGKLVTLYYWNYTADGERTLEATIWQP